MSVGTDLDILVSKLKAWLKFQSKTAELWTRRKTSYTQDDTILWLDELPKETKHCSVAGETASDGAAASYWLRVRKGRRPEGPPTPPKLLQGWLTPFDTDDPPAEGPRLLEEIELTTGDGVRAKAMLHDHPEVEEAYRKYLAREWAEWKKQFDLWKRVQAIYDRIDFMRRRLQEAEEQYELVLCFGLLTWRDADGERIHRHLLVGDASIDFEATRGSFTVFPHDDFSSFRVELDMLVPNSRPDLRGTEVERLLEEMGEAWWDYEQVETLLSALSNRISPHATVSMGWHRVAAGDTDGSLRVRYAPALVLRRRKLRGYVELVEKLQDWTQMVGTTGNVDLPRPLVRFLSEGETSAVDQLDDPVDAEFESTYFPLPANQEQQEIAERLHDADGVLVKGPPGTGKSHTIANLIADLLAKGKRVLVTAETSKALDVLLDKIPGEIRDLCVTALGSSREERQRLQKSVSKILNEAARLSVPKARKEQEDQIDQLQAQIENLRSQIQMTLRAIQTRRTEATSRFEIATYKGRFSEIVRKVHEDGSLYGWFSDPVPRDEPFPFRPEEVEFLSSVHSTLNGHRKEELAYRVSVPGLLRPADFARLVNAKRELELFFETHSGSEFADLNRLPPDVEPQQLRQSLRKFEQSLAQVRPCNFCAMESALSWLLSSPGDRYNRWRKESTALLAWCKRNSKLQKIRSITFEIPHEPALPDLVFATEFLASRLRYFGPIQRALDPAVRKALKATEGIRIEGRMPQNAWDFRNVSIFLRFVNKFVRLCKPFGSIDPSSLHSVADACDVLGAVAVWLGDLRNAVEYLSKGGWKSLLPSIREKMVDVAERKRWENLLLLQVRQKQYIRVVEKLQALEKELRLALEVRHGHPVLKRLLVALENCDVRAWAEAWENLEEAKARKTSYAHYKRLLDKLESVAPLAANTLRSTEGRPEWAGKVRELEKAWNWAKAKTWLESKKGDLEYGQLLQEHALLQDRLRRNLAKLASLRAWNEFSRRLNEGTRQSLHAWRRAVQALGKGTGKYAAKHRRDARAYLKACLPSIPAWIMPLYKFFDTVEPEWGMFDVIVVDEASQAGIDSLILFALARKIIVVGDNMQNSPMAVGVAEQDIEFLARTYLHDFRFYKEFRPDTSLYEHTERAFPSHIMLKEHFRCVPEIIDFSNRNFYDGQLIPLRQPPPDRLPPLRHTFVPGAFEEGAGYRVRNTLEARKIVEQIRECINDERYTDKTIGVITLLGSAQARLIERMLREEIEPAVLETRRIRCGDPASFQGDERDVIFLSMVVTPEGAHRAITSLSDERRINVAMSRARDQMWLFHSVEPSDLSTKDLRHKVLMHFFGPSRDVAEPPAHEIELERLTAAIEKVPRRMPGNQPEPYDSWFEVDVALELMKRGYKVIPQFHVARWYIDLVIEGEENRLAVECDGDAWHGPERFKEDLERQLQLERAGWRFVRIPEWEFYSDKAASIDKVVKVCEEMGILPQFGLSLFPPSVKDEYSVGEIERGKSADTSAQGAGYDQDLRRQLTESADNEACPDPRTAEPEQVRRCILALLRTYGPMQRRTLRRLYVSRCQSLSREGKDVRKSLNRQIGVLLRNGAVEERDRYEWLDHDQWTLAVPDHACGRRGNRSKLERPLLEVPICELLSELQEIGETASAPLSDNELERELAVRFGLKRIRKESHERLLHVIALYRGRVF